MSYKQVGAKNTMDKLVTDAFKLTYKHTYKAESIEEEAIQTPNGVAGLFYEVAGNAASAKQFFVTDSTRHFCAERCIFTLSRTPTPWRRSPGSSRKTCGTWYKH